MVLKSLKSYLKSYPYQYVYINNGKNKCNIKVVAHEDKPIESSLDCSSSKFHEAILASLFSSRLYSLNLNCFSYIFCLKSCTLPAQHQMLE